MLSCVSRHDKAGVPPTLEPRGLKCVGRGVDSVTLDFDLVFTGNAPFKLEEVDCRFLRLAVGFFSQWVPVPSARWHVKEGQSPPLHQGKGASIACSATVSGLQRETSHTLQLVVRGGHREESAEATPCICRTSDRPEAAVGAKLSWTQRRAHGLSVEWLLPDPDGAPVEECEAQYRPDSVLSSWRAMGGYFHPVPYSPSTSGDPRRWCCELAGLEGATTYRVRARARNAVGWSSSFTAELECRTSELPEPPKALECTARSPQSVSISFVVEDPEGAPVGDFSAEIGTALGWKSFRFCQVESAEANHGANNCERRVVCTMEGLQPETSHSFRLWSRNEAGWSRSASEPISAMTSGRPRHPAKLFLEATGPRSLELMWDVADPDGAPVLRCELEYCQDSLFASWITVEAECLGSMSEEELSEARLAPTSEPLAPASLRWYCVRLDSLESETVYVFRARARNRVGWSNGYSPTTVARTTELPPTPTDVSCVARLPATVQLEFYTAEIPHTAPVTSVHVEDLAGSRQVTSEVLSQSSVEGSPGISRWELLVTLGVRPGFAHTLRLWTSNEFGRCREPSAAITCYTSVEPDPPSEVECFCRSAHTLELRWSLANPEGAPVWHCEVQWCEDVTFSSWRHAACVDTQRLSADSDRWRCTIEKLQPDTTYLVRMRARNEVGWSSWSPGPRRAYITSQVPARASMTKVEVHRATPLPVPGGAAIRGLVVVVSIEEPPGAPIVAVVVRWCQQDRRAVAERLAPSRWTAPFLGVDEKAEEAEVAGLTFEVLAANAVGWSGGVELKAGCVLATEAACALPSGAAWVVCEEVKAALRAQAMACDRVSLLAAEAAERDGHERVAELARGHVELQERVADLQQVTAQATVSAQEEENQGSQLVSSLQEAMQRPSLVYDRESAVQTLALLLRCCLWLEACWRAELGPYSEGVLQLMTSVPDSSGRMLQHWVAQHHVWSQGFDQKVSLALPNSLATSAQVLAAFVGGDGFAPLESTRKQLAALLELLAAAQRQLRRLRQSRKVLQLAQGASSHNFEPPTIRAKIETTALALLTTTVLAVAVPGATECGAARIGMLWLEGGSEGCHVAVDHPTGVPLQPFLERLGWCPPPSSAVLLAGWGGGGHRGVVLVHNLTARRITVRVRPDEDGSLAARAVTRLVDSHPMAQAISNGLADPDKESPGVTVLPTEVALIQVPDSAAPEKRHEDAPPEAAEAAGAAAVQEAPAPTRSARLEFAYGPASCPENSMGWARVLPGSALSFICLDNGLQVTNREEEEASWSCTVEAVNNDLAPVTLSLHRAPEVRKYFDSALLTEALEPGERKSLQLPQSTIGRVFQVEVCHDNKKKVMCDVRAGQRISIERYV